MISPQELRIGNRVNITQGTGVIKSVDVEVKDIKLEHDNNIGGNRIYIQFYDTYSGFEIKEIIIADGEYSGIELEFNTNAKDGFILLYDLQHSPDLSDFTRAHDIVKEGTTLRFMLEKTETKAFSFNGNFNLVDSLFPIPLTEEILLKCGFEKHETSFYHELFIFNNWTLRILADNYRTTGKDVKIKSVHQLQNLYFSLVGKELEVKL